MKLSNEEEKADIGTDGSVPIELLPHLKMKIGNTESFLAAAGSDVCLMRTSNKLYFLFWGQNGNFKLIFFFNFIATKRAIVS